MRSSLQLSHRLYKLKAITLTREMMWHLECGSDFEVNRNCKKNYPILRQNRPKRIRKEGNVGRLTLLCFGCTLVVQCEQRVVLQSVEMRNFSAAECGKAIRDNLQNVPHLIFRKLPLDNFPHSAIRKIPTPHVMLCLLWRFQRNMWFSTYNTASASAVYPSHPQKKSAKPSAFYTFENPQVRRSAFYRRPPLEQLNNDSRQSS